ncbi:MAG: hypothetical protein EPO68_12055 [Planctomycetota bacterium]|nr:MAG: hypothetical protein EPO68_12055 [Planctomycetota bacterium]
MQIAFATAFAAAGLACAATAQHPLYTFPGHAPTDQFGSALGRVGDANGDGFPDFVVGAPGDDGGALDGGAAFLQSGKDASQLAVRFGTQPNERVGYAVDGAGDVDGDGSADWIVGCGLSASGNAARVYSGATGALLHEWTGPAPLSYFGSSVAGCGDVDGDGFDDVIVGARHDDAQSLGVGSAIVYSGATGGVLLTLSGCMPGSGFGISVDGVGDVDADGVVDLGVLSRLGGPGCPAGGWAYSGRTGVALLAFPSTVPVTQGPRGISGAGDADSDGHADVVVGNAGSELCGGSMPGSARVCSGSNGGLMHDLKGEPGCTWFGFSVDEAGDVDGDGFDDVIVGAIGGNYADVKTIRYGDTIYRVSGSGPFFGYAVAGVGDLDLDGRIDFAVGERAGTATVFTGCGGDFSVWGGGCACTHHVPPRLWGWGCAETGETVYYTINKGFGGAPAFLLLGIGQGVLPLAGGCTLHIAPVVGVFPTGPLPGVGPAEGKFTYPFSVPTTAAGASATMQAFVYDPGVPQQYCASNGVKVTIQ